MISPSVTPQYTDDCDSGSNKRNPAEAGCPSNVVRTTNGSEISARQVPLGAGYGERGLRTSSRST